HRKVAGIHADPMGLSGARGREWDPAEQESENKKDEAQWSRVDAKRHGPAESLVDKRMLPRGGGRRLFRTMGKADNLGHGSRVFPLQ
ncbi:MAG: hypothetical protein WB711_03525, partial [Terriglobales bacterium]